jgi:hypothetical protein
MALRDAKLAKEMDADVKAIWDEKDKDKKRGLVEAFKIIDLCAVIGMVDHKRSPA